MRRAPREILATESIPGVLRLSFNVRGKNLRLDSIYRVSSPSLMSAGSVRLASMSRGIATKRFSMQTIPKVVLKNTRTELQESPPRKVRRASTRLPSFQDSPNVSFFSLRSPKLCCRSFRGISNRRDGLVVYAACKVGRGHKKSCLGVRTQACPICSRGLRSADSSRPPGPLWFRECS